jgi:hypothetical protein
LEAFAKVLPGVTVVELRAAANLSTGAEEPWVPPVEANRLNYAQRRALESFIKATVGAAEYVEEPAPEPPPDLDVHRRDIQRREVHRLDVQPSAPALTAAERAEVESYIRRLYASGRKDLADRLAASLVNNPVVEAATRPSKS